VVNAISALQADLALSVFFDYVLRPEVLRLFPRGAINLHPAYLPWNRGQFPNVWSIVERTPAGVTLHEMDAGIDTGDVIARQRVAIEPVDTGETLYRKLERACLELLKNTWPAIRAGKAPRRPQRGAGTSHRRQDTDQIDEIHLDRTYKARDLINVIRARTFPPYPGAYFRHRGRKVYVWMQLAYETTDASSSRTR
jgi:methionyl-tRNA formyltransferase